MSSKITYSVVVCNPNSWTLKEDGSREYEITAHCGHKHQTAEAASACMARLTRWWCLCGRTSARWYAPCCGTPHNSTSSTWYHAQVEDSTGHKITPNQEIRK